MEGSRRTLKILNCLIANIDDSCKAKSTKILKCIVLNLVFGYSAGVNWQAQIVGGGGLNFSESVIETQHVRQMMIGI